MWKLKLKVCLINFLAYSFCTLFLCLCFYKRIPYRQEGKTTVIGYMYKQQEGVNSGFSPSIVFRPDTLRFGLNTYTKKIEL